MGENIKSSDEYKIHFPNMQVYAQEALKQNISLSQFLVDTIGLEEDIAKALVANCNSSDISAETLAPKSTQENKQFSQKEKRATINNIADRLFGLDEVITVGWTFFRNNFRNILSIFLIVYLPTTITLAFFTDKPTNEMETWNLTWIIMCIIQIGELFIGYIAAMALAKLIESSVLGSAITWQKALRNSFSLWGVVIVTELLVILIVLSMSLLLIIPGIIWAIYYYFTVFIVALRGLSGKAALDYSKEIVRGQWWRIFWYAFIILFLGVFIAVIISIPLYFFPENFFLQIIIELLNKINLSIFLCMTIVFFLNNDYLKKNEMGADLNTK